MKENKKTRKMPHIFVILVSIIIICTILTWILPAGQFDRQLNDAGKEIAVAGSYHLVERTPVGPFEMVQSIYKGMVDAAPVIFFVYISFASIGLIIDSGAFNGLVAGVLRKVKGNARLVIIPLFITIIGLASSTIGVFEEMLPFIPVFVGISVAMGYDPLIGIAIVAVGTGAGYAGAVMNPFTVGMAQGIADVPYMSGMGFRIISHLAMITVSSIYLCRYASRVEKDKTASYVYGDQNEIVDNLQDQDIESHPFGIREKLVLLTLLAGILVVVWGSYNKGWYFDEVNAVFLLMGLVTSIIMGWGPNEIAERMARHFTDVTVACMMIGIARGILIILQAGNIIDTIVNGLSIPLSYLPKVLMGPAMLLFQSFLNFFIPSGSGQAVTSMPIMAPLADLLGISRQISVLAFQFGDGFSNIIWPTAFAPMIAGLGGAKLDKWWKLMVPLFILIIITQSILLMIAIAIGWQ